MVQGTDGCDVSSHVTVVLDNCGLEAESYDFPVIQVTIPSHGHEVWIVTERRWKIQMAWK